MNINDEPLDDFYPVCTYCGDRIDGAGYKVGDDYYCENCVSEINGQDIAEENRDAAFEGAKERLYD